MADEVKKLIRDGKVAVIVSPDFGAGWSTWCYYSDDVRQAMLFSPEIAELLAAHKEGTGLAGRRARVALDAAVEAKAKELWPDACCHCSGLTVHWVPVGTRFVIREYDGAESLQIIGPDYGDVT